MDKIKSIYKEALKNDKIPTLFRYMKKFQESTNRFTENVLEDVVKIEIEQKLSPDFNQIIISIEKQIWNILCVSLSRKLVGWK